MFFFQRIHKLLLIWFATTIASYSAGIILTIVCFLFLYDKVAISIGLISIALYKWYGLWIVKILMREITSVSGGEVYGDGIEVGDDSDMIDSAIPLDKF